MLQNTRQILTFLQNAKCRLWYRTYGFTTLNTKALVHFLIKKVFLLHCLLAVGSAQDQKVVWKAIWSNTFRPEKNMSLVSGNCWSHLCRGYRWGKIIFWVWKFRDQKISRELQYCIPYVSWFQGAFIWKFIIFTAANKSGFRLPCNQMLLTC